MLAYIPKGYYYLGVLKEDKHMTKAEIRKQLKELLAKMADLQSDFDILKGDVEDTLGEIEPYEGRSELTPQQEERQEWLEELSSALDDVIDLDLSELEDKAEGC